MWNLAVNLKLKGIDWNISLTASDQSILTMLRAAYGTFEDHLRELAQIPGSERPAGLVEEALALLRCLVFNRLEPINGKFIKLDRKGGSK